MPEPSLYLKGFGLSKGLLIDSFKLISTSIQHQRIRSGEYIYNNKLVFEGSSNGSSALFKSKLSKMLELPRIIRSAHGSRYICTFGQLNFEYNQKKIVVTSVGYSIRE